MGDIRLTPNGIPKLSELTGNYHITDVVVQILIPTWPDWELMQLYEPPWSYGKLEVAISDGVHYTRAVISPLALESRIDSLRSFSVSHAAIIRVRKAIHCNPWSGVLRLILEDLELLDLEHSEVIGEPLALPSGRSTHGGNRIPLIALHHFETNEVPPLRALVTYKSRFDDPRYLSDSKFFVLHLLDESNEVRCYVYDDVASEIYDRLEQGKTYYISGFSRGSGKDFFYNLKNYSVFHLSKNVMVEECKNANELLQFRFDFVPIAKLRSVKLPNMKIQWEEKDEDCPLKRAETFARGIDVIGIVQRVGPLEIIPDQRSRIMDLPVLRPRRRPDLPKREVTIYDQAGILFTVFLWSYNAEEFNAAPGNIVAFRNTFLMEARTWIDGEEQETTEISLFLSAVTPSTVHVEPEVEERFALNQWRQLDRHLTVIPPKYNTNMVLGSICEP